MTSPGANQESTFGKLTHTRPTTSRWATISPTPRCGKLSERAAIASGADHVIATLTHGLDTLLDKRCGVILAVANLAPLASGDVRRLTLLPASPQPAEPPPATTDAEATSREPIS